MEGFATSPIPSWSPLSSFPDSHQEKNLFSFLLFFSNRMKWNENEWVAVVKSQSPRVCDFISGFCYLLTAVAVGIQGRDDGALNENERNDGSNHFDIWIEAGVEVYDVKEKVKY